MSIVHRPARKTLRPLRCSVSLSIAALLFGAGAVQAADTPTFKKGIWEYEETYVVNGKEMKKKKVSRCTNPTNEVGGALTPMNLDSCKSPGLKREGNQYLIATNCGADRHSRVIVTVKSDSEYTELNDSQLGKTHSRQTTFARRVGECRR